MKEQLEPQKKRYNTTLVGVNDDGTLTTEENMPYYRDENGRIVFKKNGQKKSIAPE